MFRIKIADLVIGIDNKYEYVSRFCERYKVDTGEEDFNVSATEEEIQAEQFYGVEGAPLPYCESLCLYRRLCQKLIEYDAFLMHSAALELDGQAYVFAAKSGVGKTTHMKLWLQEFGERARVINGDKPVYRFLNEKEGRQLYACGTPWCGKEYLGNNIMVPVKAICFLERSPENHIRRLAEEEIIGRIFHQLLMPREEEAMSRFMDMIDEMLNKVDFYLIQCNTEKEAAETIYKGIRA